MLQTKYSSAFTAVISDERYLRNLDWGKPRRGHPEGTVRQHIAELESNLERLEPRCSETDYWRLKLLIHTRFIQGRIAARRRHCRSFQPCVPGEGLPVRIL